MIGAEFCRVMARYNQWQNDGLLAEAEAIGDAARRAERGAFFGSIFGTLLPGTSAKLDPPQGGSVLDGLEVKVRPCVIGHADVHIWNL